MSDAIAVVYLKDAYVQENGIIRLGDGRFIGRLDDITYEEVAERQAVKIVKTEMNAVVVDSDKLEHLLNCMDNQKYIHEQNAETQAEWQGIIDKANHEMRELWCNHAQTLV